MNDLLTFLLPNLYMIRCLSDLLQSHASTEAVPSTARSNQQSQISTGSPLYPCRTFPRDTHLSGPDMSLFFDACGSRHRSKTTALRLDVAVHPALERGGEFHDVGATLPLANALNVAAQRDLGDEKADLH